MMKIKEALTKHVGETLTPTLIKNILNEAIDYTERKCEKYHTTFAMVRGTVTKPCSCGEYQVNDDLVFDEGE